MVTKVALVTGATSGIGAATARSLTTLGYMVYAAGRRTDRLAELAAEGLIPLHLDLVDDASRVAAIDQIIAEQGRIDLLVNNAGYGALGAIEDTDRKDGEQQFAVNVFAPIRLIQLVLPHMREQGMGRIVNVSSAGGKIYSPLGGWYHGTKFALEGMSDSLRVEIAAFGIDVVIVEPGATVTEWGLIAADNVERTSGNGAYADGAKALAAGLRSKKRRSRNAPARVVADAIVKASTVSKPKTRYVIGAGAKPGIAARHFLSDRAFDRIASSVMRER